MRETQTQHGERGYSSGARNPDHRARWIEHGTEPHSLLPKDAEALDTPEGPRARAEHPGTEAQAPLAQAMADVEATIEGLAQPSVRAWAAEVEQNAKRHKGIH